MGIFRTILILGLIYFGVRFITKLLFPWLLKTFVKKVERKVNSQMNQQQGYAGFKQEGDVLVKRPQKDKSKSTKDFSGGEYIDFEEVKE